MDVWQSILDAFTGVGFPARKDCGEGWTAGWVTAGVLSSVIMAASFYVVALLWEFLRWQKSKYELIKDVHDRIFVLFSMIFFTCATGHVFGGAIVYFVGWYKVIILWDWLTAITAGFGLTIFTVSLLNVLAKHNIQHQQALQAIDQSEQIDELRKRLKDIFE